MRKTGCLCRATASIPWHSMKLGCFSTCPKTWSANAGWQGTEGLLSSGVVWLWFWRLWDLPWGYFWRGLVTRRRQQLEQQQLPY